jgi:hypothetical protein
MFIGIIVLPHECFIFSSIIAQRTIIRNLGFRVMNLAIQMISQGVFIPKGFITTYTKIFSVCQIFGSVLHMGAFLAFPHVVPMLV